MLTKTKIFVAATLAVLLAGIGYGVRAQIPLPQVISIGSSDLFQDIVGGQPSTQNQYVPATLLGNYAATLPGNNAENALIGGDFGLNLFQDGTTVSSITTTATYVAEQWAAFSGTSTTLAGTQQTGAADIPSNYQASLRITRSGTGVVQSCVAQEISTPDSYRFQGQTAEFDFHALAGAGFSPSPDVLNVLIVTGTGTDQGMANLAKTINSALSGTAWTGAATLTVPVPITTSWGRYTVAAPIPTTATEIGIALCWTPVGASPSSDYFEFTGAQLVRNNSLTGAAGTAGAALNVNDPRAKAYARAIDQDEYKREYAFYWRQNEAASSLNVYGQCQGGAAATTAANCMMTFPVPMYKAPTIAFTAGTISATVGTAGAANTVSGLTIQTNGASQFSALLTATVTSVATITGFLEAGNSTGGGKIAFSARF